MAKVAILVPYPDLRELAESMARSCSNVTVMYVDSLRTNQVAQQAAQLEEAGCELIVARGRHASAARQAVKVPVLEMRVATPELGAIMLELKEELGEARPRLGLIGFRNMFYDVDCFDRLLGVEVRPYLVTSGEEMTQAVEQAVADGCQGVIGGDTVCAAARHRGLPCRFLTLGRESLEITLEMASRMCYAIDLEKRNSAEMDLMLNNTFSGILRIGLDGTIQRVNRAASDILGKQPAELVGRMAADVIPTLGREGLEAALAGQETYAAVLSLSRKAVVANLVPIRVSDEVEGALLTFQEGQRIIEMDSKLRGELYQQGYIARRTFDKLPGDSQGSRALAAQGKRIAKYTAPILITGERGVGKGMFAQCIHNASLRAGNAFVSLDCGAWQGETLDTMLFGNYTTRKDSPSCLAEMARDGTLYLSHVEALPMEVQYKVLNLIQGKFLHNGPNQPGSTNVRIIASTDVNLVARVERGEFRSDLYYALSVLRMDLPPLRQRREDILAWMDFYLRDWQERYKRYIHLTQGAKRFLEEYDWPGNLDQLENLCGRMVLLTEKRSIDETFLRRQLEQVTPKLLPGTETVVVYKDQRAVEIAELLKKHEGNREKVSAELGVSKTTLWRYMKKYGIEKDFSY